MDAEKAKLKPKYIKSLKSILVYKPSIDTLKARENIADQAKLLKLNIKDL